MSRKWVAITNIRWKTSQVLKTFDRERIPERVVHARGAGAHGYFESFGKLGDDAIGKYTRAKVFTNTEKKTPVFVRFSTVIHGKHSPF